jgi:hypothetical protein
MMDTIAENTMEARAHLDALFGDQCRIAPERATQIDIIDKIRQAAEAGEAIAVLLLGDDVFEEVSKPLLQAVMYDLLQRFETIKINIETM